MSHPRSGNVALVIVAAAVVGCERPGGSQDAPSSPASAAASVSGEAREPTAAAPPAPRDGSGDFAALHARLSEPAGAFPTQGYVSNELTYLQPASALAALPEGGVYLGVGPEQNYSYIALTRPDRAYLVDVRRDNALLHLLYKAAFELASTRAHFLALVTGRDAADAASVEGASLDEVIALAERLPRSESTFQAAHARLMERVSGYGVPLSADDRAALERIHRALHVSGLDIRLGSADPCAPPSRPRYRQLLTARDPADGQAKSFLATDASFRLIQEMHRAGRIIPVVGDIAGGEAMRALGRHLQEHDLAVSTFYVSNVEQYLRQRGTLARFVEALAELPRRPDAVLVRTRFAAPADACDPSVATGAGQPAGTTLEPIAAVVGRADAAGQ